MHKKVNLSIPVPCAREECGKLFVRERVRIKYCCEECKKLEERKRADARNVSAKERRKLLGKPKKVYRETVKCPKCEDIYSVLSDTPPGNVMRREYCHKCKSTNLEPFHVFSIAEMR